MHVGKIGSCFCSPFLVSLYVREGRAYSCTLWICEIKSADGSYSGGTRDKPKSVCVGG